MSLIKPLKFKPLKKLAKNRKKTNDGCAVFVGSVKVEKLFKKLFAHLVDVQNISDDNRWFCLR